MALLGAESWDIFATADIPDWWTSTGANTTVVPGAGRCGSGALHFNSAAGSGPTMAVNPGSDGGYCGFGRYLGSGELDGYVMLSLSGYTAGAQLFFVTNNGGGITVYRGPNTVLGAVIGSTPNGLMTEGHWYHLGFEWLCVDSGGYVKVWVNNVLQYSVSGVNTRSTTLFSGTASLPWSVLGFSGKNGYIDDIYWGDSTGSAPWNAFLGDLRVEGQVALTDASGGGGTHQDFTPLTGTDHGAMVDDAAPDDDATYLAADTAGKTETLKFPNITLGSGTVYGIQLMPNVLKLDSGGRTIACVVRQGGVDTTGRTQGLSQTNYIYTPQMFQTNPTSAGSWTATTANNMEGGITIVE